MPLRPDHREPQVVLLEVLFSIYVLGVERPSVWNLIAGGLTAHAAGERWKRYWRAKDRFDRWHDRFKDLGR